MTFFFFCLKMTSSLIISFCLLTFFVSTSQQGTLRHQVLLKKAQHEQQQAADKLLSVDSYLDSLPDLYHHRTIGLKYLEKGTQLQTTKDSLQPLYGEEELMDDVSEEANELSQTVPTIEKAKQMDKLIYELVQDGEKEAIRDHFETTVLKAVTLKSKLDMKIDETILALQNLKNLRRHIENAYSFANRFVHSKVTNDEIKRYVVTQLDVSIQQVEQTLNYKAKPDSKLHSADSH